MPKKKLGRPLAANPKKNRLELRLGDETMEILNKCSEKLGTSRTEVIEIGIRKVRDTLTK